jgi:beta-aspartyl-dipeptidase (metallo-type)
MGAEHNRFIKLYIDARGEKVKMITVIKAGEVYAPQYLGKKDVVLVGDKIEGLYDDIEVPKDFININVVNAEGKLVFPGFIDSHVHIIGGGGEGGYKTRTPEIVLSDILAGGITTVVGCLGTDATTRDMKALIAKAKGLEEEGITTYTYTGSYAIPVKTLTDAPSTDIIMIDKIIGIGEIALSDHRSSQPTYEEFVKVVAAARVAGLLSGKAGAVNVHLGDGKKSFEYLHRLKDETEIPITQVIPTHINRSSKVFEAAVEYGKCGGILDLTTSSDPEHLESSEIRAGKGIAMLLKRNIPIEQIQCTSDAQGSLPIFDTAGKYIGLGIGSVKSLYREVKEAITEEGVPIDKALMTITSNVAEHLKLSNKGKIEKGKDADIVIVNKESLNITDLFAKGRLMIKDGEIIVKGTFEK